ncbi:unnamed protein product [Lactuca saligna]|uniref:DUF4378 domain-containing protein n=1 Tax=Lactuca saligna TaxID=75948 RepID=A0AA35Z4U9_LACSI|nr:unnamed protein product [Lactuca saligna]
MVGKGEISSVFEQINTRKKNMPQERLRSVVYRSFVTCEDPRGVVEGKTIRISKIDPTKTLKNSKEKAKEKEKMSSSKAPSSYELVEVKNGAQKLNEAIDSWSNGGHFRSQPKDIAKDLLKGALDLQESLMMLGKLQEASCMAKLKKKQEKSSEVLVGKINSDRFESFQSYDMGFEKQRKSENGSSKDCYSELRDVIRDGLSKQNLLPNKSFQESVFAGERKLQLSPDMASTSSSRSSSMVYSTHEFTSSESLSSRATEDKSKGSNLIAKLMGLDEFPSKPIPSTPINKLKSSKMRPFFDVDLPNGKKPNFFAQKMDREHMTLDGIIKMVQTKGLLRSNKREIKQKRFEDDDVPPIVLMKPQKGKGNVNVNTNSIRKLHQEKAKAEEKAMKSREKSGCNKQKGCVQGVMKQERKQEMEKKIDKIQKIPPQLKKKQVENVKLTNSVSKNDSLKPKKKALTNPITKRISSSGLSSNKSSNQKKNVKLEKVVNKVNEPLTTIIHEVLQIDSPKEHEIQDSEVTRNDMEETGVSDVNQPKDEILKTINSFQDSEILKTINSFQDSEILKTESNIQDVEILKTVSSFQDSEILKTIDSFQDFEPTNFGLFQDCVNEFLEHESRRKNPWLTISVLASRNCGLEEDELMREIVKGVENLRNYSKFSNENSNGDKVYEFLERDLCFNKMGGTWSSGWKDGCTLDEVEEAVLDLEKIVLSKLIDDMLMELVLEIGFRS